MPTIVYLLHGMGAGASESEDSVEGAAWSASVRDAMKFIGSTFALSTMHWLDEIPETPPSSNADAIWIVPLSYHEPFDQFREQAVDRQAALKGLSATLTDLQVARLSTNDFLWTNCLDVLLWWADESIAGRNVASRVLDTITAADRLARTMGGAPVRRILISHSLGTAVGTFALRHLAGSAQWTAMGGFDLWMTLANVAPFLIEEPDVYSPPLIPRATDSIAKVFVNVKNEADPIPWLLPWRAWDPMHAGGSLPAWQQSIVNGRMHSITTRGVCAPPSRTPKITNVHGFANYLLAPRVAELLAGAIRGAGFSADELAQCKWPAAWMSLPRLSCVRDAKSLEHLVAEVGAFRSLSPTIGGRPAGGWFERLLSAADMLLKWRGAC